MRLASQIDVRANQNRVDRPGQAIEACSSSIDTSSTYVHDDANYRQFSDRARIKF